MSKKRKDQQDEQVPWGDVAPDAQEAPEVEAPPTELVGEPEPEAPPAPAPVGARPPRGEGVVALEVFLRLAGPKPDQMVPFARWAAQRSPRPKPLAAWKAEFAVFMNRPVSG